MKNLIQLFLFLVLCINVKSQIQVTYFIQGHQDDWQLFMSSKVINELNTGGKVVFITLTAGDGGNGTASGFECPIPFFLARERGSVYSSKYISDFSGGTIADTPSLVRVTVNGRSIVKYSYNNNKTISYFLRLPDGNSFGQGFGTNGKSLKKLFSDAIPNISSIEGITTYTSWSDLVTTIKAIIRAERGTDNQVWINTAGLDTTNTNLLLNNSNDHSDHYYSARAVQDAIKDSLWVGINEYINYRSFSLPANLTVSDHENATAAFGVYLWALKESRYNLLFDSSHKRWLPMDYFYVKRSPVGNAANIKITPGLTEIPMIVSITTPAFLKNDISVLISPFEVGKLNTTVYDSNGKLIFEKNTTVENRDPLLISLGTPFTAPGIYAVKNILNNKYIESRKISVQ